MEGGKASNATGSVDHSGTAPSKGKVDEAQYRSATGAQRPIQNEFEEDVEPQFGFKRLGNNIQTILAKDNISSLDIHDKYLVFGTFSGMVYISTHIGNVVKKFESHTAAVNELSISIDGEYFASCSDDGKVAIYDLSEGLQSATKNSFEFARPVKSVCIDPSYTTKYGVFVSGGLDGKLIISRRSLFSYKHVTLHSGEGQILAISWSAMHIAFATPRGVRIYDLSSKQVIKQIEKPHNVSRPEAYNCSLYWENSNMLLIGWERCMKIARISGVQGSLTLSGSAVTKRVEVISRFQLDSVVCGIVPFSDDDLVLLFHVEDDEDELPEMRIINKKTGAEKSNDGLPLSKVSKVRPRDLRLVKGNDAMIFIVSPKDVIVATQCGVEDHIKWLFDHRDYKKAAELLPDALEQKLESWETWISNYLQVQMAKYILPHIPLSNPQLSNTTYELLLNFFLATDLATFKELIHKWPSELYSSESIANVIIESVKSAEEPDKSEMLDLLAHLYENEKKYAEALAIYIKLRKKETFDFIKEKQLEENLHDKIHVLAHLNPEKAIEMFIDNIDKIPAEVVVRGLRGEESEEYLYKYLHGLFKKDNHAAEEFHGIQVRLYTKYDKSQLLSFLIQSDNYPLEQSYKILEKENCYKEMVFILERMGNNTQALDLIVNKIKDPEEAVDFVRRKNDEELWEKLIDDNINNVDMVSVLLEHIGGVVDPVKLIKRIPIGLTIVDLKKKIVKIIADYTLQMSLREGCQTILVHDCVELSHKLLAGRCRAIHVSTDMRCSNCGEQIIKYPAPSPVIVFFCNHCFHAPCLQDQSNCPLCNKFSGGLKGAPGSVPGVESSKRMRRPTS